jgi:hypothetical protein
VIKAGPGRGGPERAGAFGQVHQKHPPHLPVVLDTHPPTPNPPSHLFFLPLQSINRTVEIIECQHAQVDLNRILDLHSFDLDRILSMDPEFLEVRGARES